MFLPEVPRAFLPAPGAGNIVDQSVHQTGGGTLVRTFSEPAVRSLDDEPEVLRGMPDGPGVRSSDGLAQQVERLRRIIDELAAVLADID